MHEDKSLSCTSLQDVAIFNESTILSQNFNQEKIFQHDTDKTVVSKCNVDIEFLHFAKFKDQITSNIIVFISNLYLEKTIARKSIQSIVNGIQTLLMEPLSLLEEYVLNHITVLSNTEKIEVKRYFEEFQSLFQSFESEHLRLKYFEQHGFYVNPCAIVVGQCLEKSHKFAIHSKNYTAQYISIAQVLQKFFSLPDVFSDTLKYIKKLQNEELIYNIIQTEYLLEKQSC